MQGKLLYAQSGGVTAVINATAGAVVERAREAGITVYAARDGIVGALAENLVDTGAESDAAIAALAHTPGGAFGSCRYRLKSLEDDPATHRRLLEVMRAHDIRGLLYNGGNDSADTALKLAASARTLDWPLTVVAIPKTIDNDLALTDTCPGFGSAAKYIATATAEAALDVASMHSTSTQVFIMEVMGRHAGWLAAASGLAGRGADEAPHLILFPEREFELAPFLAAVKATVERNQWCVVVASEGLKDASGRFLSESGRSDAFGHAQLGGVAPRLAQAVGEQLGFKTHWAVPDYLQRSARHLASATDLAQAQAVGRAAVEYALAGRTGVMPAIRRLADAPYEWELQPAPLEDIANRERKVPAEFLRADGFGISEAARRYLQPLIGGEAPVPFAEGLPLHVRLQNRPVPKRLPPWERP